MENEFIISKETQRKINHYLPSQNENGDSIARSIAYYTAALDILNKNFTTLNKLVYKAANLYLQEKEKNVNFGKGAHIPAAANFPKNIFSIVECTEELAKIQKEIFYVKNSIIRVLHEFY